MSSNLRPDLEITQVFEPVSPIVQDANNPLVMIGVNRQIVWREDAGDFVGGQEGDPLSFPNLIVGSKVEQPSASEEELRPHVFISGRYGVSEVTPTYDFAVDPPQIELSPTLSAVFEIASGNTGEYASSSGKFVDSSVDFIEAEVAAGDVIKVDGVDAFLVTNLVSDTEIDVSRVDKAGATWSGDLSTEDLNGDRILTDLGYDFEAAGVMIGDLVTVEGWDVLATGDGVDFSAEVVGVRTITAGVGYDFAGAGVQPPVTGPPYQVDIIWVQDSDSPPDWYPAFKVSANVTSDTLDAINLITTPAYPGPTDAEVDKVFEIYHYTQVDLTGGSVWTDANGDWTADGTPVAGQRTFSISGGNPNGINFSTLLTLPLTRYNLVVHGINDAGGTANARPIFKISSIASPTSLVVENWDPDRPQNSASGTATTWEIWDDGGAVVMGFQGASITAEGPGGLLAADERLFTSTIDMEAAGVAVGDTVYSAAGVAMFEVTTVGSSLNPGYPLALDQFELGVTNLVASTPPASWSDANFPFYVTDVTEAIMRVTRVLDANNLTVRNTVASTPPEASAFTDLLYSINVADSLSSLNYTIEKTVSGASLTGDVLVTYTARRNDSYTQPFTVKADDWESLLGQAVPANPLALAAKIGTLNSNYPLWVLQVPDDLSQDWINTLNYLKTDQYYILCPLTQNETVLSAYRAHVLAQSTPEIKRDRILFQSHLFERIKTRTTGSTSTFTKTATVTTVTITGDLSSYGVIVGDVMSGTADVSGTEYDFEGRIITLTTGASSVLTIVNDNGIGGTPPVSGTITDWTIQSKDLTDTQFAMEMADYAEGLGNRRFRNVFPSTCQVTFSDQTDPSLASGLYGGGDVISEVGGQYQAAMFAAMRSSQKPAQALTKVMGTGIYRVLNPFGDFYGGDEDTNDIVLNGGNWIATQDTAGGDVSCARAVTTDTSDIQKLEDSVTVQVDNFSRILRKQIKPLLGPFNIEETYFDMVSTNVQAVIDKIVLEDKDMKFIEFLDIRESETIIDTFELDFEADPFISAARAKVTIYV